MRAVIQRVLEARVTVNEEVKAQIAAGLLIFLGIEGIDTQEDISWLCSKIVQLRIFDDENGIMNRSVQDVGGEIMVVSQFTLHASTKKGNRPSYIRAAKPEAAIMLYEQMITQLEIAMEKKIASGQFQAHMKVALVNDGPVTILMDSRNKE